jgi:hypothetical protein
MRSDFLQPDPADAAKAAVKRTLERADMLYGRLDEAQRKLIADGVGRSPFDPEAWLPSASAASRHAADPAPPGGREGRQRPRGGRAARTGRTHERSPDPAYRAYQQRLTDYNCGFAAQHPQRHDHPGPAPGSARRLKGWEDDLRALAAAAP